ncbi:hypothetical protein [Microlunatus sp. GCM10028923]|uniref:hypothetical protein n=1 Tax=Microlunatus sp. GCM10028923 TaxID=3273400 RepID=UPI003611255B
MIIGLSAGKLDPVNSTATVLIMGLFPLGALAGRDAARRRSTADPRPDRHDHRLRDVPETR